MNEQPYIERVRNTNKLMKIQNDPKRELISSICILIVGIILLLWGQSRIDYAIACANSEFVYYEPSAIQEVYYWGNILRIFGALLLFTGIGFTIFYSVKFNQKNSKRFCPKCGRQIPFDSIICSYCKYDFK